MKVELSHNPYTIRTKIVVDGETVTIGKLRDLAADDHRLQMWIDRFFPCLLDVYDSPGSLNVTFQGTQEDYDDLCEAAQAAKDERRCAVTVSLRPTRDPENILQGLKLLFEEAKTGPIPEFRDADLDSRFQECVDPDFEVSVIATMKAGKSTFLNAMIGRDLLPEDVEPCTATVTRVRDTDGLSAFQGRRLCSDSDCYSEWQEVSRGVLEEWNKDDIRQIEIEGDVPSIVSKCTRLVVVDTPGPNNARNTNHGACLVNFIKKDRGLPPIVLYLLNAKTLFTNDNQILLQMVSEEMKKAGKQSRDRFMFVMTHADSFDAEKGKTIEDRMEGARCYLENYDINAPNLFPINGLFAKLVRCRRNGEALTNTECREIDNWIKRCQDSADYKFFRYMTLSPSVL
ncbi:MAG TPA: dynamin family protein, partial [Candidatus Hydrogenedentes bacterium]|nr:dynamin family protein [Candidatus Hydrogenedentota bacterium]